MTDKESKKEKIKSIEKEEGSLLSKKRKQEEMVPSHALTIDDIPKIATMIKEELSFPTKVRKMSVEENNTKQKLSSLLMRLRELTKVPNIKNYQEWQDLVNFINEV